MTDRPEPARLTREEIDRIEAVLERAPDARTAALRLRDELPRLIAHVRALEADMRALANWNIPARDDETGVCYGCEVTWPDNHAEGCEWVTTIHPIIVRYTTEASDDDA